MAHETNSRLLIVTLGTRGDIEPFLHLGRLYACQGQAVTVLSNANWEHLAVESGLDFVAITHADPSQSGRDDKAFFRDSLLPAFQRMFVYIGEAAKRGPISLIFKSGMLGVECAAAKFGLPAARLALQPSAIPSIAQPPWPLSRLAVPLAGPRTRALFVKAAYAFADSTSSYAREARAFRRYLNAPHRPLRHKDPIPTVLTCPEWFAPRATDWPANVKSTDFIFAPPRPDPRLLSFITHHGRPIVFTPGTGVTETSPLFTMARALCARLGRPGVFLSPSAPSLAIQPDFFVAPYAELGGLLPHAALFVHHGGIGSVAQAARAGAPQIVIPDRFDQPDNAVRIAELGLGAAVFQKAPSLERVAQLTLTVLKSPEIAAAVSAARQRLEPNLGLQLSFDMVNLGLKAASHSRLDRAPRLSAA